jgi:hypothetical protein
VFFGGRSFGGIFFGFRRQNLHLGISSLDPDSAQKISRDLVVVHITPKGQDGTPFTDELMRVWEDFVEKPAREAGFKPPELVILHSPYRLVTAPIFRYVLEMERKHPDHPIAVLVPELVEWRWYYYFLHNQRATALKVLFHTKGTGRIIVISVPSYMRS